MPKLEECKLKQTDKVCRIRELTSRVRLSNKALLQLSHKNTNNILTEQRIRKNDDVAYESNYWSTCLKQNVKIPIKHKAVFSPYCWLVPLQTVAV